MAADPVFRVSLSIARKQASTAKNAEYLVETYIKHHWFPIGQSQ